MAKRVNKRFLITLTVTVTCGIVVLGGFAWYSRRGNAAKDIAFGNQCFEQKDYKKALDAYSKALRITPSKELLVKAGNCINELTRVDREQLGKDVRMWERALERDPAYVPALRPVMEAMIDICELQPRTADNWARLREKAKRLAAAAPDDIRAKAYEHAAAINEWLLAGRVVPEREIEGHLSALGALLQRKSDETADAIAVITSTIADTRLRFARDRQASGDAAGAKEQRDMAVAVYEEVLKTRGENPAILYRYYFVQRAVADVNEDGRIDDNEAAASRETLARAAEIVPKGHKDYFLIKIAQAQSLQSPNTMDKASDYLRALLKENPDEIHVRLALAQLLRSNPDKRTEAMELLSRPLADDPSLKGFKAVAQQELDFQRLAELTLIQIDACRAAEEKDRESLRAGIEENLRLIARADPKHPTCLKLRGYYLLLEGNRRTFVDGIQLMEEAVKRNNEFRAFDPELQYRLAIAYVTAPDVRDRQPGQARTLLQQLIAARPDWVPARKLYLNILLGDRQYEQARVQIAILEKTGKDDLDLVRARIVVMAGLGELDKARPVVEALPESTRSERLTKAAAAQAARLGVLAERLIRVAHEEELRGDTKGLTDKEIKELKNYAATQMLVRALLSDKKREEAIAVVRTARVKDPKSARLQLLERILDGKSTPDDLGGIYEEIIAQSGAGGTPGVTSAIQKAELYRQRGELEEALKVVTVADAETPDDPQLLAAMFGYALQLNKADVVDRCAAKLEKLNADHANGLYYRTKIKLARRDFNGALEDATSLTRKLESFASSWVVKGQAEQGLKRFDIAISSYSRATERQADNFEALFGLYECHLELKQYALAKNDLKQGMRTSNAAYFSDLDRDYEERYGDPRSVTVAREQAARDNPDSPRASLALVQNYLAVSSSLTGKKDAAGAQNYLGRAQNTLQDMLRKWPDNAVVVERLAWILRWQDKGAEALEILKAFAAREAWKDKPQPWLMIAQYHVREQHAQEAEKAFQKALGLSSNNPVIRQQLANFYFQSGQADRGTAILKALADETKDPEFRSILIEVLIQRQRVAEAEVMIRESLEKNPRDARMLALRAFVLMKSAEAESVKDGTQPNYDEAGKFIEQALKIDPQNSAALYYRGMIGLSRGPDQLAGAVADLTTARNLAPNSADIRSGLFDALRRRGQIDEAASELESAVQLEPYRRDLRQKLLTVYFAEKRWVQAERVIEEAKQNSALAGEAEWRLSEAQMWIERGDLDRAMAPIIVASRLAPNDPQITYAKLNINIKKKDYDEVLQETNKMIAGGAGKSWWMWMCRASALKNKGRFAEADTAFDSALAGVDAIQDNDGIAAERLVAVMVEALGADKTAEKLAIRVKPYWLLCRVRVHASAGNWDKAVVLADEVRSRLDELTPPQRFRATSYLGQTYTAAVSKGIPGTMEKAEQVYTMYLADAERGGTALFAQIQALNNLAYLFGEGPQPNLSKALNFSKRAYDLMVKANYIDPSIADTHGWMLILSGHLDEGIEILQQLTTRDKPIPDVHYHLAEGYIKRLQLEEAQASIEQARIVLKRARDASAFVDPTLEGRIEAAAKKIQEATKSGNPKAVEKNP